MKNKVLILIVLVVTLLIVGAITAMLASNKSMNTETYISSEHAFETFKTFLGDDTIPRDGSKTELSFLANIQKWNDPVNDGFVANEPELVGIDDLGLHFRKKNSDYIEIWGDPTTVSNDDRFWLFAWTRMGERDVRYDIFVDAARNKMVYIRKYTSPD
jgi:hypothetical protein